MRLIISILWLITLQRCNTAIRCWMHFLISQSFPTLFRIISTQQKSHHSLISHLLLSHAWILCLNPINFLLVQLSRVKQNFNLKLIVYRFFSVIKFNIPINISSYRRLNVHKNVCNLHHFFCERLHRRGREWRNSVQLELKITIENSILQFSNIFNGLELEIHNIWTCNMHLQQEIF